MRWGCLQLAVNGFEYGDEIFNHIVIPKTHDAIAMCGKVCGAFFVRSSFISMLAAVELDHQFPFGAGEIGNAIADGVLAAEFVERQAFAQGAPEDVFGAG